jgi:hypothetical protein
MWKISTTYFGSMITNDAKCMPKSEIKSRIAMANAAFSEEKNLFQEKGELKFKEETSEVLHLKHSRVWCLTFWHLSFTFKF